MNERMNEWMNEWMNESHVGVDVWGSTDFLFPKVEMILLFHVIEHAFRLSREGLENVVRRVHCQRGVVLLGHDDLDTRPSRRSRRRVGRPWKRGGKLWVPLESTLTSHLLHRGRSRRRKSSHAGIGLYAHIQTQTLRLTIELANSPVLTINQSIDQSINQSIFV